MSLVITVVSYQGVELSPPLTAHFDASGGSVGRSTDNQLILPDPERGISRIHAELQYGAGGHKLVNRSGNPLGINGRKLLRGQSSTLLKTGDRIQIGAYMMHVETQAELAPASNSGEMPSASVSPISSAPAGSGQGAAPSWRHSQFVCSWEEPAGEHQTVVSVPGVAA